MAKKSRSSTSPPNPGFDFASFTGPFDPARLTDEFAKIARQYRLPGVDMNRLAESQRRNVEALTAANQAALDGMQALAKRQGEFFQESLDYLGRMLKGLASSESPQAATAKQVELFREAYDRTLGHSREIAELIARSNRAAADVIHKRVGDALDELRTLAANLEAKG